MKVSVVIPVYNEIETIEEIVSRVQAVQLELEKEIIIVDDSSTNGTRKHLKEIIRGKKNVKLLFHNRNQGKGAALRTGFQSVTGDIIIIQDADLELKPDEYSKLLQPILNDKADIVYGSRFLAGSQKVLSFSHYAGNKFLTSMLNAVHKLSLTDMMTCYKVFKKQVLKEIALKSNRFGFEPEFTAKIAKKGFQIYEVPISYSPRSYRQGKKITWKDGIIAAFTILWFRIFD